MTNYPVARAVSKDAGVDRVLVNGKDITWFRATNVNDGPTRIPDYSLIEPFAYGASAPLVIPRTNSLFETYGSGDLSFIRQGAEVLYQRVLPGGSVVTDYRGVVIAIRSSGREFVLDVNGEIVGRANLLDKPPVLTRKVFDLGTLVTYAMRGVGKTLTPRYPATGLEYPAEGGTTLLSWMQKLCALSQVSASTPQRTIMPETWGGRVWTFEEKDLTTVDLTLYADGTRVTLDLVDDAAEQPNTIFGSGVTPGGIRWRNARYPGFFQGTPPDYPIAGGAPFGIGTEDADTVNGDGITVLRLKLASAGYLEDGLYAGSEYDAAVAAAVDRLKDDAGLTEDGTMTELTWAALWDTDVVGFSLEGANIHPIAQASHVRTYNYSSTGGILGLNDNKAVGALRVDRTIDYGVIERGMAKNHAKSIIHNAGGHQWSGTITLNDIGAFTGEHDGTDWDTLDSTDLMPARNIRPGMNVWLPYFDGGTLLHISQVDPRPSSRTVSLTVSTTGLDAYDLALALQRNRESRRNIYREWMESNRGIRPAKNFISRDEYFGRLDQDVRLTGGTWNVIPMIVGTSGTVSRTDIRLADDPTEFCVAVFGKKVTPDWINGVVGDPFVVDEDGLSVWEHDWAEDYFDQRLLLYVAGQADQPCGYGWKKGYDSEGDRTANPLTGTFVDDSTWSYIADPNAAFLFYMAIYPLEDCKVRGGRLFFALEDDVT